MQKPILLIAILFILTFLAIALSLPDEQVPQEQVLTGSITDYFSQSPILKRKVDNIVSAMTDTQLAGQVLMPAWEHGVNKATITEWICKEHIGGFMILGVDALPQDIASFQSAAQECGHAMPLFVSIDAEPTLIAWNMRVKQLAPVMKAASSLTTKGKVTTFANMIHTELAKMGVTINFAPVVDSNTNKAIISERSFGGSSEHIKSMASTFNNSAINANIIPTIKHFPGHGSVQGDSHKGLVMAPSTLPELGNFDTKSTDVPLVMVGHIAVRDGAYNTHGLPSTLSPIIMKSLLRDELGYKGLVITDAMNMGAVDELGNTTVRALKAGADIILMPMNTKQAHNEVLNEMQQDERFREVIKEKVARIIRLKVSQEWSSQ